MTKTNKNTVHVYPENDEKEHVLDNARSCWCKPKTLRPEVSGADRVVTHRAADGRELVENELHELLAPDKTWTIKAVSW